MSLPTPSIGTDLLVAKFKALFTGREDAYGLGRGAAVRQRLTVHHYLSHLQGEDSGIGVYPMMEGNVVRFAAIDLDCPDFDFVRTLQPFIPGQTWIERSRSGNAHLWAFFTKPCPAWVARGLLRKALEYGGRPNVEVFPKQDRLRDGMLGNYINLPYHGTDRPVYEPYARRHGWDELPVETFVKLALGERIDPDSWERRVLALGVVPPEQRPELSEFGERENVHPCAEYIYEGRHERPLQPGHRHDVLFALSKQLLNWRALSQDTARRMVHEVNEAGVEPAPRAEVDRWFDTVLQAQYTSTGCDEPLVREYARPDCPVANGEV